MTAPHPHSRAALDQRFGPNYRWWVLLTVMIGTMASIMASTIINVAVPDMSRVFGLGQERAQWLSAGFMAAMTLSMLTTPWLLERYGYRHTYTGAVLLLMAGGIAGGLSPWFDLVLAMRVAEGLAAGVLQPIPAIIIMRAFGEGTSRARRWASSASASCSRRRSGRASAACWSSGSAGARSSSSSCRSASPRCCWRGATCRWARRAAAR